MIINLKGSLSMKKLIALLLAAIMCLSLCACGKDAEDSQGGKNDGGSSSSASKEPTVKEEKEFVLCREWMRSILQERSAWRSRPPA